MQSILFCMKALTAVVFLLFTTRSDEVRIEFQSNKEDLELISIAGIVIELG